MECWVWKCIRDGFSNVCKEEQGNSVEMEICAISWNEAWDGQTHRGWILKKYKLMASGTTPDGLTYEDFATRDGDTVSAIRYCFDGDTLKKIFFASYGRNEFGDLKARRCIVKVLEFSASPDQNLLRLPAGLVDATKR